jgi:hypothetical protein
MGESEPNATSGGGDRNGSPNDSNAEGSTRRNQTPDRHVLGGFTSKDSALYNSAFGKNAVVIDGIAPYRWSGPNAQAQWFSDAEKWVHDFGVENENIVCDRIVHATVVGTHAYVVLSAMLFFNFKKARAAVAPESSPLRSPSKSTSGGSSRKLGLA